ncbi:MAG TPA: L-seryl-tRNA(Sec) selenium transferase [Dissulfurispiraceae bacterium]|nr:L-seryl-tRNA(Sec) selenium transferase [Dissulfurispiraceae bacterium]
MDKQKLLSNLPSVDEIVKSEQGTSWQKNFPRVYVVKAVREIIRRRREAILAGRVEETAQEDIMPEIERLIERLSGFSLKSVINATGVVIHTNLGRSVLSKPVLDHVIRVAGGYSNLEYDIDKGERGKRYSHVQRLLTEITGAEAGIVVNNNAAAVFVCLAALAKGREVIVSRGELVEIGGSFRIPDVMASSGAILREVGTTNKTHRYDYENAVNDKTALMLKVHQSNFRMIGFAETLSIEEMVSLGKKINMPVMFDLGSGCLVDLRPYGIHIEPTVQEIVKTGADIVTFSGDKLLGGPQAGVIVGKRELIDIIAKYPLMRAVRVDKMTLAALEATLRCYLDEESVKEKVPTVSMLLQTPAKIRERAKRIAQSLTRGVSSTGSDRAVISVIEDVSQSGGGALAEVPFQTYAVSVVPAQISVNALEDRLRLGNPPVISRIKDDALILDVRTVKADEIELLVKAVRAALA